MSKGLEKLLIERDELDKKIEALCRENFSNAMALLDDPAIEFKIEAVEENGRKDFKARISRIGYVKFDSFCHPKLVSDQTRKHVDEYYQGSTRDSLEFYDLVGSTMELVTMMAKRKIGWDNVVKAVSILESLPEDFIRKNCNFVNS